MTLPPHDTDQDLLLHAYADDELDPAGALAVEQRLRDDPAAAARLQNIMAIRKQLRDSVTSEPVPHALMTRINAAVGARRPPLRPSWPALAASVLLALGIGSGATWLSLQATQRFMLADEVVSSHMRSLMASSSTDVKSSERHVVKPWFNGRVPVAPRVIDLAAQGFPLLGGRIDVFGTTPVPTIVYGRRLHIISLSAIPTDGDRGRSPPSINGYNIVRWSDGETVYWAVSDLNKAELTSFAELFRNAPN